MSYSKLKGAGLLLAALFVFSSLALAQQTPQPNQPTSPIQNGRAIRRQMRARAFARGAAAGRIFGGLNLTDAQREQMRAIRQRYATDFQARRAEIRKLREQNGGNATSDETRAKVQELREQMRASKERMRAEMLNVLTAEQRAQFDQIKSNIKARREEIRARRRANKANRPPQQ